MTVKWESKKKKKIKQTKKKQTEKKRKKKTTKNIINLQKKEVSLKKGENLNFLFKKSFLGRFTL